MVEGVAFMADPALELLQKTIQQGIDAIGNFLHQAMQHRTVLVFTMVNGAAKYMAPKEAYASNKYEAMNSPFAEGSAERLCDGVLKVLHKSQK